MAVICAVIGVPAADRPRWHGYGAMVSAGDGKAFAAAIPAIIDDAKAVLAAPEDGLVTDLVEAGALDRHRDRHAHLAPRARGPGAHPAPRGRPRRPPAPPRPARRRAGTACRRRGGAAALVRPAAARGAALPERGRRRRGRADRRGHPGDGRCSARPTATRASSPIPTRSTSAATPKATWRSCTARTSASAPPSPGWRRRSRSPRCCDRWPDLRPGEAVRAPDPATWRLTTFTAVPRVHAHPRTAPAPTRAR